MAEEIFEKLIKIDGKLWPARPLKPPSLQFHSEEIRILGSLLVLGMKVPLSEKVASLRDADSSNSHKITQEPE